MAVDYNIYIHAIGGGSSQSNPTIPWSAREGGEGGGTSNVESQTSNGLGGAGGRAAGAILKASSYMQNPDSIISKAFTNIGKAFPIAAAAYAVVKLGESIVDNCVDFGTIITGDYRSKNDWFNFKRYVQITLHPFSSTIENFKNQSQINRENLKLRAQRDLLGDSVINSYTNRGV